MTTNITPADILERAAERLAKPEAWTRGATVRNRHGVALPYESHPDAACWCLLGALWLESLPAHPSDQTPEYDVALGALKDHLGTRGKVTLATWNDKQESAAPVVAALRLTAARLRGEAVEP